MAWNRPMEKKPPIKKRTRQNWPIVAIVGLGICLTLAYFFFAGRCEQRPEETKARHSGITEKKASRAKPTTAKSQPGTKNQSAKTKKIRVSEKSPERELPVLSPCHTNDAAVYRKPLPFNNVTEQALLHLFSTPVGLVPFPTGVIPPEECKDIVNILASPCHVSDKDDDLTVAQKELIRAAKKEMAAFIGDGGTPNEFIDHYRKELMKAWMIRSDAETEINRIAEEEDPALAKGMIKKVNELLREQGIVELSDNIDCDDEFEELSHSDNQTPQASIEAH